MWVSRWQGKCPLHSDSATEPCVTRTWSERQEASDRSGLRPQGWSAEMPELAEGTEGSVEKNERGPHSAGGSVVAGGRAGQGRGLASWVWRDLWLWQGAASHSRTYEAGRSKAKAESSQEPPEKTPPGARAGLDRRTAEAVAGAAGPGEAGLLACAGRWEVGLGRRPRACHPGSGPERGRHSQVTDKKSQAQDGYAQGDTAGWKQKRDPPDPGFTRLAMVSSVEGRAVRTPASWCGGRRLGPPGPSPSAPPNLKLGSHSCSLQTGRSFSQQAEPEGGPWAGTPRGSPLGPACLQKVLPACCLPWPLLQGQAWGLQAAADAYKGQRCQHWSRARLDTSPSFQ